MSIAAVLLIAGLSVALLLFGSIESFEAFAGFIGPALVALIAVLKMENVGKTVNRIEHNTNGVLDKRIAEAVKRALEGEK